MASELTRFRGSRRERENDIFLGGNWHRRKNIVLVTMCMCVCDKQTEVVSQLSQILRPIKVLCNHGMTMTINVAMKIIKILSCFYRDHKHSHTHTNTQGRTHELIHTHTHTCMYKPRYTRAPDKEGQRETPCDLLCKFTAFITMATSHCPLWGIQVMQ